MKTRHRRFIFLGALFILLASLSGLANQPPGVAHAATTTITSCDETTLRTAISNAAPGDTIQFSMSSPCTITLTEGTIRITKTLTLDASGSPQSVTLSGGGTVQVFLVFGSSVTFTLNTLTIAHGSASEGGGLENAAPGGTVNIVNSTFANNAASFGIGGGGLLNVDGTVNITNSTFANNSAFRPLDGGGGLENFEGTANITTSTFANNSVNGFVVIGGGLDNGGTLTLSNSTFANNSVMGVADGGGLSNGGTANITTSTFVNNVAGSLLGNNTTNGGGLFNVDGTMSISNSTITNNSAGAPLSRGGGLQVFSGTVNISNSTIANNTATRTGGGIENDGGTVRTVRVAQSIVANNTPNNCSPFGFITDEGYNLESSTDCGFTASTDLQLTNPRLAALASNGGPTQTLALLDGSPAINKIPPGACAVATDQRGVSRPQGPACDMGAFEFRVPTLSLPTSPPTVDATSPQGATVTYTATASLPDDPSSAPTLVCSPLSGSTFPIGTTTVTCTASDAASPPDSTTGSFQVVVKGAAAQISDLIALVDSFALPQGLQTSLDAKLQAALQAVNSGQTSAACNQLSAFINEVQSQAGKMLTPGQAQQLLAAATQIQAVLAC